MKRIIILLMLCTLLPSACSLSGVKTVPTQNPTATQPVKTQTLAPQISATVAPQTTPKPTSSPTPGITPTEVFVQEFIFANYDKLAVDFDPELWMSEKGMGQGMLIHLTIPGCEITDQGPTEPPRDLQPAEFGDLNFNTATFPSANGSLNFTWYMLQSGINNPYKAQGTVPILIVQSPKQENEKCVTDAQIVLETLHPVVP